MRNLPHSVFIVDDHELVVDGIKMIVQSDASLRYIGRACSLHQAKERLLSLSNLPDLIICDYQLQDGTGLELMHFFRQEKMPTRFIIISMLMEGKVVRSCWANHCEAFLGKNVPAFELLNAIAQVMKGNRYISSEHARLLKQEKSARTLNMLSKREHEILELISIGLSSKKISNKLGISKRTVDVHWQNILRKSKVRNTAALILKYTQE